VIEVKIDHCPVRPVLPARTWELKNDTQHNNTFIVTLSRDHQQATYMVILSRKSKGPYFIYLGGRKIQGDHRSVGSYSGQQSRVNDYTIYQLCSIYFRRIKQEPLQKGGLYIFDQSAT